jgi:hypothetical protein
MKEIGNTEPLNALRLQHHEARRRQNPVCGKCGQLSHCLPDNVDAHRVKLLDTFRREVAHNPAVPAPGGPAFTVVAAE